MLGCQHQVRGAEQGVRTGREDLHGPGGRGEAHPGAIGPADPVPLHLGDRLGPVDQLQVTEQPIGVGGDPHHPLGQRLAEHRKVAALAPAVRGHLLVGEDRPQPGAPVHHRLGAVRQPMPVDNLPPLEGGQLRPRSTERVRAVGWGTDAGVQLRHQLGHGPGPVGPAVEPGVEDLQEDPLCPPVIGNVGGGEAPARVVAQPQPPQLPAHGRDIRLGGLARVAPGVHRVLLGWQAERVIAHCVQHVEPRHALVARIDVRADIAQRVTHMQAVAAGVREHVQHVQFPPTGDPVETTGQVADRVGGMERALHLPATLPELFDPLGQRRGVPERRDARPLAHQPLPPMRPGQENAPASAGAGRADETRCQRGGERSRHPAAMRRV